MYTHVLIFGLSWLIALITDQVESILILEPSDVVAVKNSTVVLPCYTNLSIPVYWEVEKDDDLFNWESIYQGDPGFIPFRYEDKYNVSVDSAKNQYNLTIRNVQPEDAGTYRCSDDKGLGLQRYKNGIPHNGATAELIVIVSDLECWNDITEHQSHEDEAQSQKYVLNRINCSFAYRGKKTSQLNFWLNDNETRREEGILKLHPRTTLMASGQNRILSSEIVIPPIPREIKLYIKCILDSAENNFINFQNIMELAPYGIPRPTSLDSKNESIISLHASPVHDKSSNEDMCFFLSRIATAAISFGLGIISTISLGFIILCLYSKRKNRSVSCCKSTYICLQKTNHKRNSSDARDADNLSEVAKRPESQKSLLGVNLPTGNDQQENQENEPCSLNPTLSAKRRNFKLQKYAKISQTFTAGCQQHSFRDIKSNAINFTMESDSGLPSKLCQLNINQHIVTKLNVLIPKALMEKRTNYSQNILSDEYDAISGLKKDMQLMLAQLEKNLEEKFQSLQKENLVLYHKRDNLSAKRNYEEKKIAAAEMFQDLVKLLIANEKQSGKNDNNKKIELSLNEED